MTEAQQRARWDLLLLDIEQRTEQIRQMKTRGRRLAIQAVTAAAAVFVAGVVVGALIVWLH